MAQHQRLYSVYNLVIRLHSCVSSYVANSAVIVAPSSTIARHVNHSRTVSMGPVEVAGLALAVLPILMTAAGYPIDAPITVVSQRTKDRKLIELYMQLHDELTLLSATLRGLISSLSDLEDKQRKKLLELDNDVWNDALIGEALAERLGASQKAFVDNLDGILQVLEEIVSGQVMKVQRPDLEVSTVLSLQATS